MAPGSQSSGLLGLSVAASLGSPLLLQSLGEQEARNVSFRDTVNSVKMESSRRLVPSVCNPFLLRHEKELVFFFHKYQPRCLPLPLPLPRLESNGDDSITYRV